MKTSQVMQRSEGFLQRTNDSFFNATALINSFNKNSGSTKMLKNYKIIQGTTDFIKQLQKEGIEEPMKTASGSGPKAGTWMHPKLFIDFAMWLSVEFKSVVIDYVLDGLIKSRNDAGDYYNEMTATILDKYIEHYGRKPHFSLYIREANLIRDLAGVEKNRNELTEKELMLITTLQKVNTELIRENKTKEARKKQLTSVANALSA